MFLKDAGIGSGGAAPGGGGGRGAWEASLWRLRREGGLLSRGGAGREDDN